MPDPLDHLLDLTDPPPDPPALRRLERVWSRELTRATLAPRPPTRPFARLALAAALALLVTAPALFLARPPTLPPPPTTPTLTHATPASRPPTPAELLILARTPSSVPARAPVTAPESLYAALAAPKVDDRLRAARVLGAAATPDDIARLARLSFTPGQRREATLALLHSPLPQAHAVLRSPHLTAEVRALTPHLTPTATSQPLN